MDKKDLKQIGELIHKEIKANNGVLMDSVDKKFEINNEKLIDLFNKKFETNNKILMDSVDKKFKNNNELLSMLIDLKFDKFENRFEQKMLNWKSEIVNSVDVLAKEIRDEREFREISSHQTSGNTKRIEKLESKVFGAVRSGV